MSSNELDELRRKRDELKKEAAHMRKDWIRTNSEKILFSKKGATKQPFYAVNLEVVAGVSIFLNILTLVVWSNWYIGRDQYGKIKGLVKKYQNLSAMDKSLWLNCSDVAGGELSDEEFARHFSEAAVLLKNRNDVEKTIEQTRSDLNLE